MYTTPSFLDLYVNDVQAELDEDLNEWKTALENALAQAPSPPKVTGQNFQAGSKDMTMDQCML